MPEKKAASPIADVVERSYTNKRNGETRHYQQVELTIEGEARILGIVRKVGKLLIEKDFDWAKLSGQFGNDPLDWDFIFDTLGLIAEEMPAVMYDSMLILLGIYPTDEDGTPNPEYEVEREHLRKSTKTVDWYDMVKTFTAQNDYQRLAAPFWARLRPQQPQPAPLGPSSPPPRPSSVPGTESPEPSSGATPTGSSAVT